MDVALVLTHRCNLACDYCYAGEHHKTDIDPAVLEHGIELLFADAAETVQLSFFGGEPFLAFDAMKRAVLLAERRAAELGRRLLVVCTTNGSVLTEEHGRFAREHRMRVTVSMDGVPEVHDRNRPRAGGGSSFEQVHQGLRRLLDAGVECDAMMVITPKTVEHTYLSVSFLWGEGVRTVRANLELGGTWGSAERAELREQLVSVGYELLARRLRGEPGAFEPFDRILSRRQATPTARARLVVATTGNLYPCAPMVGEDRDHGPEAALRLGHVSDGAAQVVEAARTDGVRCGTGGACACAAYLETGDRRTPGPVGRYYALVCDQVAATIAEGLATHQQAVAQRDARRSARRPLLVGLAAVVGAAAVATPLLLWTNGPDEPRPCSLERGWTAGELVAPPGGMEIEFSPAPPDVPPPDVEEEVMVLGEMILDE